MSRRAFSYLAGAAALLAAAALWLPDAFTPFSQADPAAEPASADLKMVAAEAAFLVTLRPSDFTGDELVKAVLQDAPEGIARGLHVSAENVERLTAVVNRHGDAQLVRTKKPYDPDRLGQGLSKPAPRFGGKDKSGPREEAVGPDEVKVGGKTIKYYGPRDPRWARAWCAIDKHTFLQGSLGAVEAVLAGKGKPSEEMADAVALAGSHSLVMAVDGKRLRAVMRRQTEEYAKPSVKYLDKDKRGRVVEKEEPKENAKDEHEGDDVDAAFGRGEAGVVMLPYKPLLSAKFGVFTLDLRKTYTLDARIAFADKADLDDGETALKSALYAGGELMVMLPKFEREFAGLRPLSLSARKAFKGAKVERRGTTLRATVSLTPEEGSAEKVREAVAAERKKVEEQRKRWEEERMRFREKEGRPLDKDPK